MHSVVKDMNHTWDSVLLEHELKSHAEVIKRPWDHQLDGINE